MVVQAPAPATLDRKGQHAIRELRKLRAARDELDAKIKTHEQTIKAQAGDAEEIAVGGRVVATYKRTVVRRLSKTLVEKRAPEIIEECMVLSERRTFKLIEDE